MGVLALLLLLVVFLVPIGALAIARLATRLDRATRAIEALRDRVAALERGSQAPAPDLPAIAAAPPAPAPVDVTADVPAAVVTPPAPTSAPPGESLESRIGGQWLLYAGVFAILLGVAYFEKLAFENAWLGETARVVQGAAAGLALVYAGARFARAGYRLYGHAIEGAGIAALYVSVYASFNYYQLIDRPVAFALMVLITVGGVMLADRQDAQGLAALAVGGGFITPFLLPGNTDTELALFGYDLVLLAGTTALARRRRWLLVDVTSYTLIMLTVALWADRYYTADKYFRTEIFLSAFCGPFVYILMRTPAGGTAWTRAARAFLLTAPLAYYGASLAVLWDHPGAFLIWLVLIMTAGAAVGDAYGLRWGAGVWAAVAAPLLIWASSHTTARWFSAGLWGIAGVYVLALAAQIRAARAGERPRGLEVAWIHLNGLAMFAAAYILLDARHIAWTGPAAALFAVWQGTLAWLLRRRGMNQHALQFAALGLTFVAIAIALQFDGPAVTTGWAAEALVVVLLGFRERRAWLRTAGLVLFAIACLGIEWLLFAPPVMGQAVLFNRRAAGAVFVIAVAYALAAVHARGGGDRPRSRAVAATVLAAQIVTLSLVTSEIDAYWLQHHNLRIREVMRSVAWAAYGTALILVGLRRDYAPIRIFAILVLAATALKVFFVDLSRLERVYRVLSVLGVGVMLLAASYLYQKTRRGTGIVSARADGHAGGPAAQ